jgi:hypothetical protein
MFILSEIRDDQENFLKQTIRRKKENDKKVPVTLSEIAPVLQNLYGNIYDINLHIYKASRQLTVVDIRYYPKSALERSYRLTVVNKPPMLHCKIAMPPWLSERKEKFDINWEKKPWQLRWKLFWIRQKRQYWKQQS